MNYSSSSLGCLLPLGSISLNGDDPHPRQHSSSSHLFSSVAPAMLVAGPSTFKYDNSRCSLQQTLEFEKYQLLPHTSPILPLGSDALDENRSLDTLALLEYPPSPSDSSSSSWSDAPSCSPSSVHVVCNAPLVAPIPLPYHSPTFLQFDLPDFDQDLSHPPYTRCAPKRKRNQEEEPQANSVPCKRRLLATHMSSSLRYNSPQLKRARPMHYGIIR